MGTAAPLLFDFKGNSHEDGPGIRSVLFFKGCPLDCLWCQNPEGKRAAAELWWEPERCLRDGACMAVCPAGAITPENPLFIDRERCSGCLRCAGACPSTALSAAGREAAVEETVARLLAYRACYQVSGGGVTLSGGEPTLQMEFAGALLRRLKAAGVHTLLQTCGLFPLARFEAELLPWLDAIQFDLKLIDPPLHRRYCGADNAVILGNFTALAERAALGERGGGGFNLLPRTALIPGLTDTAENLHAIAALLRRHGLDRIALLPNNPVWLEKPPHLGWLPPAELRERLGRFHRPEELAAAQALFAGVGIAATIG